MDKAAERPPLRPSVPRLHLSTFNPDTPQHCDLESLQLTTCRSDTEDFILPTSFRTSRAKNDSVEKIPGQLERLTGLIDNMMDNLKDAEDSKSLEDMQLASRDFICQLSTTDSCSVLDLERAFMSLEDASASELRHREEKLDLQRVLRDTQLQLDLALKMDRLEVEMQSGASVSSLQHRFDEPDWEVSLRKRGEAVYLWNCGG